MYPDLVTLNLPLLGRFTVSSFGAMMGVAVLAGWWVIRAQVRERELDPALAADVTIAAMVGGLVGAKVYYALLHWLTVPAASLGALLFSRTGLVWYGGFLGGLVGVWWLARRRERSMLGVLDLCAPALALAYGIGRIGCFLVGDDYGRPTESWVGIAFPEGSPPTTAGSLRENFMVEIPASVPDHEVLSVIPTQPFETGIAFLIFLWLWNWRDKPHGTGWLFGLWMALAGAERFAIEFFRAKDDRILGPFSTAQAVSLALIAVGAFLVWTRRARLGERPAAA